MRQVIGGAVLVILGIAAFIEAGSHAAFVSEMSANVAGQDGIGHNAGCG